MRIVYWLALVFATSTAAFQGVKPKKYDINLDLPPIERWRSFITDNRKGVADYVNVGLSKYNLSEQTFDFVGFLANYHWDTEFIEELRAISELSGVKFGKIVLINYIYELNAYCTSIVARNSEGIIIHGRNLDYDFRNEIMNSTADCDFYKNGSLIFSVK